MVLAAAGDVLAHPLFVTLAGVVVSAAFTALGWLIVHSNARTRQEMREANERALQEMREAVGAIRTDLRDHMGEEERQRSEDHAAQTEFRTEMRTELRTTRDDVRAVHARIDTALLGLAAGNPEIRRGS